MLSMENYDSLCDLASVSDISKRIRLMDIKRGSGYLRTIDNLAQRQWTSYAKAPDFTLGPVDEMGTDSKEQILSRHSQRNNMDVLLCDKIAKTSLSHFHNSSVNVNSSGVGDVPLIKASGYTSLSKGAGHTSVSKVDRNVCFNTWGSREWDLEEKLVPEVQPRIIMPKRGVMMSRVAKHKENRRFRTNTDFRSRNGTIRIINPPKPQPSIEQGGNLSIVDSFDPDTLKREQTYMMLKRIDQLLHPNRVFKGDLTSSELEIHSNISSQTDSIDVSNMLDGRMRSKTFRKNSFHKQLKAREHPNNRCHQQHPFLLPIVVQRLDNSELDCYQKCQQWVDRWITHSNGKTSIYNTEQV